jgi:hypothetical protein
MLANALLPHCRFDDVCIVISGRFGSVYARRDQIAPYRPYGTFFRVFTVL